MRDLIGLAMVVKDGALTIRHSIMSIVDCVRSVHVVDHGSSDNTLAVLDELKKEYDNIFVYDGSNLLFHECRNLIIDSASEKYLLKWDVDFVALRAFLGADFEFKRLLFKAVGEMEFYQSNLCVFKAYNIGFGLDCVISKRPFIGGGGDIRMYKRSCSRYKSDKFADQFEVIGEVPKRLYYQRADSECGILHLDLLKDPYNIAFRTYRFRYQKYLACEDGGLGFIDWCEEGGGDFSKGFVERVIDKKRNECHRIRMFDELIKSDFYGSLNDLSPFVYSFDEDGRVVDLGLKPSVPFG